LPGIQNENKIQFIFCGTSGRILPRIREMELKVEK
jgi:hypothetical protein